MIHEEILEKQLVGLLPARDAELLKSRMEKHGIEIMAITNDASCKSGCTPSKEVWAHPADVQTIHTLILRERMEALADLGADVRLLSEVFDPLQPQATCPACGFKFETALGCCADCGLNFSL